MEISLQNAQTDWNQAYALNTLKAPFLSYAWHELWFKTLGKNFTPFILKTKSVILSFALQSKTALLSGGYEIADYLDILGPDSEKPAAWIDAVTELKKRGIETVSLRNIPENSTSLDFLKQKGVVEVDDTTPTLFLPKTWDEFLSLLERKHRHELRRKLRKFEEANSNVSFTHSPDPQNAEILFRLMKQNPEKAVFLTPSMENYLQSVFVKFKESIIFHILKQNEQVAAMTVAFLDNRQLFLYNSGFNETDFSGSGFYVKAQSIKWAIENQFNIYNFLQGNERYKYELGGKDFAVYKTIFSL